MNEESLKKVLNVLIDMKASMHDTANTGAIKQLDEAIELIQEYIGAGKHDTETQFAVLSMLGKIFDKLPSINALLQLLS